MLNQRHELLAVRLVDPRERSCPTSAWWSSPTPRPASSWRSTRPTASSASGSPRRQTAREAEVSQALRHAGVDAVTLSTDDDLVRAIVRMAAERRRRVTHA